MDSGAGSVDASGTLSRAGSSYSLRSSNGGDSARLLGPTHAIKLPVSEINALVLDEDSSTVLARRVHVSPSRRKKTTSQMVRDEI